MFSSRAYVKKKKKRNWSFANIFALSPSILQVQIFIFYGKKGRNRKTNKRTKLLFILVFAKLLEQVQTMFYYWKIPMKLKHQLTESSYQESVSGIKFAYCSHFPCHETFVLQRNKSCKIGVSYAKHTLSVHRQNVSKNGNLSWIRIEHIVEGSHNLTVPLRSKNYIVEHWRLPILDQAQDYRTTEGILS